jgi:hypothetical protein
METVAAIVVLTLAVPPMLLSIREAAGQRAGPTLSSLARWLATERLEDVIADRHSATRGYAWVVSGNYPAEAQVPGFANFSRSVSVVETAADLVTPGIGYKRVTVTVGWTDPKAGATSLALATILTDYPAP